MNELYNAIREFNKIEKGNGAATKEEKAALKKVNNTLYNLCNACNNDIRYTLDSFTFERIDTVTVDGKVVARF